VEAGSDSLVFGNSHSAWVRIGTVSDIDIVPAIVDQ
jgi:hypothetical protein